MPCVLPGESGVVAFLLLIITGVTFDPIFSIFSILLLTALFAFLAFLVAIAHGYLPLANVSDPLPAQLASNAA